MRTRPRLLAFLAPAALGLAVVACTPPEEGDEFARWTPQLAECGVVNAYLDRMGEAYEATDSIRIHLDGDGKLTATPYRVVVRRDQTIRWHSPDLRWTIRFVRDTAPLASGGMGMAPAQEEPRGMAQLRGTGNADGYSAEARISGEASCGLYHYVVAAHHPETDSVYVLDPPMMVRN